MRDLIEERDGKPIDLTKLENYEEMGSPGYAAARGYFVRACHDVFIAYGGGILLVVRDTEPAKGLLWPIGGGMAIGVPTLTSLRNLTRRESGLELPHIEELGDDRMFWANSPSGNGIDDLAKAYFARGEGKLNLDVDHKEPRIVTPDDYSSLRESLHPYVQRFMDSSIALLSSGS